ncbi:MAG TPA: hypothetical protein DEA40_10815 [Parvularcula sp.]|nr:hypothetical protein [Parvularcula sp.]
MVNRKQGMEAWPKGPPLFPVRDSPLKNRVAGARGLTLQSLIDHARSALAAPGAQAALKIAQVAIFLAVVILLIVQLSEVGWGDVFAALPESPWFYLIFTVRYFLQPLSEIPAYELVWKTPLARRWTAFIRKRVYNFAVMGYSGEAFFTLWARRNLKLSDRDIVVGVKDNNLVSALVSNAATTIVVVALFFLGDLERELKAIPGGAALFGLAFVSAASLMIAVVMFRRHLIQLPRGITRKIIAINAVRIVIIMVLHATLYAAALPGPPLTAWLMFVALQLVLSRIPFVPNQDIVFLTAALALAPEIGAPEAAIAGMLVAEAGLSQIFNLTLFALTAHHAVPRGGRPPGR